MSKLCSAYMKCVKRFPSHFFFQYFFIKYSHNYIISFHNIVLLVIVMFQQHKVFPWWFTANYWGILANSKCCLHDAMPDFYPFVFRNTGPSGPGGSLPHPHILARIEAKPPTSKDLIPPNILDLPTALPLR